MAKQSDERIVYLLLANSNFITKDSGYLEIHLKSTKSLTSKVNRSLFK